MKQMNAKFLLVLIFTAIFFSNSAWSSSPPKGLFMIKTTSKSMTEVVDTVKNYSKEKKWVYLGDFKIKKGKVILVKFCIKAVGKIAWKAGLHVSAMLPCGNMGVYQRNGKTEISLLNPSFMTSLYPDPNLTEAVKILTPLFKDLMNTIVE